MTRPDRVVLYSAIYGGYDRPKPLPAALDVPAVMITDNDDTARTAAEYGWSPFVVRHGIVTTKGDPAKLAPMLAHKWWKTHPHALLGLSEMIAGYTMRDVGPVDVALWVDGSMILNTAEYGARCLQALGDDDIAFTSHPWRGCAIAEGEYSATLPRYANTPVAQQTAFYARFHPRGWGLLATGAIAWRVNPVTRAFGHVWWDECLNWSHQDQVSLPVLLRLAGERQLVPLGGMSLSWNKNLPWERWWTLAPHSLSP